MDSEWLYRISPCVNIVGHSVASQWVDPRRVIYDHELMCFGDGTTHRIEFDSATYECPPRSFIIIPPGRWHTGSGSGSAPTLRTWVHFDWVFTPPTQPTPILTYAPASPRWKLVRHAPAFVPGTILTGPLPHADTFFASHRRLEELFTHGTLRERLACRGLFLEMLLGLLSPEGEYRDMGPRHRTAADIRRALDDLAQQPFAASPPLRTFLSSSLGCSYDHVARVFRAAYGVTPLQYVNSRRIERARLLLRETPHTVASIARELGFRDVVYFNRLFRRLAGMTPGRYRKEQWRPRTDKQ